MPKNHLRNELAVATLLFILLAVWAVKIGWQPLSAWAALDYPQSSDPDNIVRGALRVVNTGDVYVTVDAPLRYVPLAIIYAVTDASGLFAERIAHLYTTLMSFVALPGSLYLLFRATAGKRVALLTLLGFAIWRIADVGRVAYYNGYWHYSFALPIVFLAFWLAHHTIQRETNSSVWAVGTGAAIGVLGLNQYVLAGLTALTVAAVFGYRRRFSELAITSATGCVFAVALVLAPQRTGSFAMSMGEKRLGISEWSLSLTASGVVDVFTLSGYVFIICLMGVVGGLYVVTRQPISHSNIVEGALVVVGVFWLLTTVLVAPRWFSQLAHYILQYLLLGGICTLGVAYLDQLGVPVWEKVQRLTPPQ